MRLRARPPEPLDRLAVGLAAAARLRPPLHGGLMESLRRCRRPAEVGREVAWLRTLWGRLGAARAGRLDGIVQRGTEYHPLAGVPFVTYEDRTVLQAARHSLADRWLEPRALETWVARQRRAYELARACCVTSRWAADSIVADYGIPREKVHVVGAGRNHEIAPPARRDWSVPRYLWIGMEWERKGGPAAVGAFQRLRADRPEATLDLVGRHPELNVPGVRCHGPLGLEDRGARRRVRGLLEAATCLLTPSLVEPLGIANAEAMGAGLPVIVGDVGGAPELVGDAGRVVDPHDGEALLAAMRELARPELAERLGALAGERARLFTWRAVAERVLRALAPPGVETDGLAAFL